MTRTTLNLVLTLLCVSISVEMAAQFGMGANKDGYYFFDDTGKKVFDRTFEMAWPFTDGLAAVQIAGKWGFINETGKEVIDIIFEQASSFSEGLSAVKLDEKWGYINKAGEKVIDMNFDQAHSFVKGLAAVRIDKKWGYINSTGEIVIKANFEKADKFRINRAIVKMGSEFYLIDSTGQTISSSYDSIRVLSNQLYLMKQDSLYGILDTIGQVVQSPKYQYIMKSGYDQAIGIKLNGKWGNWTDGVENFEDAQVVFVNPEVLPVFGKECLGITEKSKRQHCSSTTMIKAIYSNIQYPAIARKNRTEGTAAVQFIINQDGGVETAEILRAIGDGCDEEAVRVVLTHLNSWAQPAMHAGGPVNMLYRLPVKFRLK